MKIGYSIILPVRNEAQSLPQLFSELKTALRGKNFEVLAVNDASTDGTRPVLKRLADEFPQLTVISLSEHLGKWEALRQGLAKARGETIVTLDSDLQDDPGELPKLLSKLAEGYDVVSGWRRKRQDPWYKVTVSRPGNQLVTRMSHYQFHDFSSPFKVFRREALNVLPTQGSLFRYSLLFAQKLGLKIAEVPVVHRSRRFGRSKFGLRKYLRIIYDVTLILLLFSGSGRINRITQRP